MKLALFFTLGVSLKQWLDTGLFEREKLLYERLLENGTVSKVFWLTYGTGDAVLANELRQQSRLHFNIEVVPMPSGFNSSGGKFLYSLLVPVLKRKILKQADILKTNQASGSWSAVLAKKLHKRALIFRTGYTWSRLKESQKTSKFKLWFIKTAESLAYKSADAAVVTTKSQADYVSKRYRISADKIHVIPNYIDTAIFHPDNNIEKYHNRLVYIGRLDSEKNLFNLLTAVKDCGCAIDIYGSGRLENQLREYAEKISSPATFRGSVPNSSVPEVLNKYRYFVLPSFNESLPKGLLEAMSCGLVCIGTDVTGINEVITNAKNGYLAAGTDTVAISAAIKKAISQDNDSIISEAVLSVKTRFSIETVLELYKKLISNL